MKNIIYEIYENYEIYEIYENRYIVRKLLVGGWDALLTHTSGETGGFFGLRPQNDTPFLGAEEDDSLSLAYGQPAPSGREPAF